MKLKVKLIPSISGTKVFDRYFLLTTEGVNEVEEFIQELKDFSARTNTPLDLWTSEDVIGYSTYIKWAPTKVRN